MKVMKPIRRALCAAMLAIFCCPTLQAQTLVLKDTNYEEFLETYQTTVSGTTITC